MNPSRSGKGNTETGPFPGVQLLFAAIDDVQDALPPSEEALLEGITAVSRRREFTAGRTLARRALRLAGLENAPPLLRNNRAPVWPSGWTGSISHSQTHCAVTVARKTDYSALGLDLETLERVHPDLWSHVFTPRELEILKNRPPEDQIWQSNAGFSAKEAFFKLQYPLTGRKLGFFAAEIDILTPNRLQLRLMEPLEGIPQRLTGWILRPIPGHLAVLFALDKSRA